MQVPTSSTAVRTQVVSVKPAPSATPTRMPRPKLDEAGVNLGLVAELGLGRPWEISWSGNGALLRILSPAGMTVLEERSSGWAQVAAFPEVMADALQATTGLGWLTTDLCSDPWIRVPTGLSSDGSILAYLGDGPRLEIWNLDDMERIASTDLLQYPTPSGYFPMYIKDIQISAGGSTVAALEEGRGVHLYDSHSGAQLGTLVDQNAETMLLSVSEDEAITGSESYVQRWDLTTRKVLGVWRSSFGYPMLLSLNEGDVTLADWRYVWVLESDGDVTRSEHGFQGLELARLSPPGTSLLASESGSALGRFGEEEVRRIAELELPDVYRLRFSPDQAKVAAISCAGQIIVGDLAVGIPERISGPAYSGGISGLAFSPDGRALAVASPGWPVGLWDAERLEFIQEVGADGAFVDFSPDGTKLVIASEDEVLLWDFDQRRKLWSFHVPFPPDQFNYPIEGVAIRDDGRVLVSHRVGLFSLDTETGEMLWQVDYGQGRYADALISHGGELVLIQSYSNSVDVRDGSDGRILRSFLLPLLPAAISPDLREVVTLTSDGVRLWSLETGEELRSFEVPLFPATVSYSSDGKLLAVGGASDWFLNDNLVVLAQPLTKQILAILEGQTGLVSAIAVSPIGDLMATGASDGSIRLWGSLAESTWAR